MANAQTAHSIELRRATARAQREKINRSGMRVEVSFLSSDAEYIEKMNRLNQLTGGNKATLKMLLDSYTKKNSEKK